MKFGQKHERKGREVLNHNSKYIPYRKSEVNKKVELSEPHDIKPSQESITVDKRAEVVKTYGEPIANEVATEKHMHAGADIRDNNSSKNIAARVREESTVSDEAVTVNS